MLQEFGQWVHDVVQTERGSEAHQKFMEEKDEKVLATANFVAAHGGAIARQSFRHFVRQLTDHELGTNDAQTVREGTAGTISATASGGMQAN